MALDGVPMLPSGFRTHPQLGLLPTAFPLVAAKVDEEVRTARAQK